MTWEMKEGQSQQLGDVFKRWRGMVSPLPSSSLLLGDPFLFTSSDFYSYLCSPHPLLSSLTWPLFSLSLLCLQGYYVRHGMHNWLFIHAYFVVLVNYYWVIYLTLVQHNNYNMFILLQKKKKTSPPLLKKLWR